MIVSYVMFDITNRCNFRCKHCYKGIPSNAIDSDYPSIIGFLKSIDSCGQTANVILSGGEPLMFSHLYELLDSICDGRKVRINTNACLLEEHVDKLLGYANLELQISLDGYDDETYYHIRNNHHFSRVLQKACSAEQKGLHVFFRTTLTKKTIRNYLHFIDLSEETGIPLTLRPMINTGLQSQEELAIDFDTLQDWYEECISNDLTDYTGEYIVSPHCPLLNEEPVLSTLTVDVLGNVYPCLLLKSDPFYMGNIYKDSYDQILRDITGIKNKLSAIINDAECLRCGFRKRFGDGTCVISCFLKNRSCIERLLQQQ